MKTQMKKIAIAIVMIIAFCGSVNAQHEISVKNDNNEWIAGNWKYIPGYPFNVVSRLNYRDISISGIGGDTVCFKLVDTTIAHNPISVWRWAICRNSDTTTISNVDTAYYVLPKDTMYFETIRAYYNINNVEKFITIDNVRSKFLPPTFELDTTIIGAKNSNVNLTLADFGLAIDSTNSLKVYYNTINWYRDGSLIPEETGLDTITVDSTGNYSVQVEVLYFTKSFIIGDTTTKAFSKWESSNSIYIDMAIINSFEIYSIEKSTFNIYPNPTQNTITIEQPFSENTMISIFDITGQMVIQKKMESPVQQIDISSFPNGSYFIQVKSNNKTEFGKIVKL
jgi:hypothetical protein